jgi:ubiquinone/menaquinone biosynthesis C-methylase UbiE
VTGHRERKRALEVALVRKHFTPGTRVLEFGAGNGWQASLLQEAGCRVEAIDVEVGERTFARVQQYDGRTIPFGNASFDAVFSSNVLEHVRDVPHSLAEIRRVLRDGGRGVFILPSVSWRFWTSVTAYPELLKRLTLRASRRPMSAPSDPPSPRTAEPAVPLARRAWRTALAPMLPHGEFKTAVHELYYFSRRPWMAHFAANGFVIDEVYPTGIFYTGADLVPGLPYALRTAASRVLGSAANVFVVRRV